MVKTTVMLGLRRRRWPNINPTRDPFLGGTTNKNICHSRRTRKGPLAHVALLVGSCCSCEYNEYTAAPVDTFVMFLYVNNYSLIEHT